MLLRAHRRRATWGLAVLLRKNCFQRRVSQPFANIFTHMHAPGWASLPDKDSDISSARSLFVTKKPKKLLHPSFEVISSSLWSKSTRRMMNDAFARFVERDGNFI
ncbi:hypothetical protein P0R31_33965 [Bradyrhizobium yuanmingense]|uniref:hypothetical protein n=1 Tax=Bradyrhizobium yuanmingense TaxID=108015 RepID=UPI0023B99B7A|nr:hypothetical protein [Bradyrhizobium yuanmingense]MDF0522249.1 hypothetical protein [Bradyrhizobium yuanmingense]